MSIRTTFYFIAALLLLCSCENNWTPEAEGYFTVDGIRYDLHLATNDVFDDNSGGLNFVGPPYCQIELVLSTAQLELPEYSLNSGSEGKIITMMISYGRELSVTADENASGMLTIGVGDAHTDIYNFTGQIGGHDVVIYYHGLTDLEWIP